MFTCLSIIDHDLKITIIQTFNFINITCELPRGYLASSQCKYCDERGSDSRVAVCNTYLLATSHYYSVDTYVPTTFLQDNRKLGTLSIHIPLNVPTPFNISPPLIISAFKFICHYYTYKTIILSKRIMCHYDRLLRGILPADGTGMLAAEYMRCDDSPCVDTYSFITNAYLCYLHTVQTTVPSHN